MPATAYKTHNEEVADAVVSRPPGRLKVSPHRVMTPRDGHEVVVGVDPAWRPETRSP